MMVDIPLDKILYPFSRDIEADNSNDTVAYHVYERIRTNCSFELPSNMQNIIHNNKGKLNILHINARSIVNKVDDLCSLLKETAVTWHIISISETWLTKNIEDYYNIPEYQAAFCSRASGTGGGSAIYIASYLSLERLDSPIFTTAEVVSTKVKFQNTFIIICQIYRSPRTNKNQCNTELENLLIWVNKVNKITLISGDFNLLSFLI